MGPLAGLKVLEIAGIGPAPMCAMLLADMGATVLRVDRTEPSGLGLQRPLWSNFMLRGRHAVSIDLKSTAGRELALELAAQADVLVEGFLPGVMERLGLGPEDCAKVNPRMIYGRMTGWGQTGPLARVAGHDINYIALTGALHSIGRESSPPTPPLAILGDYAGGALYLTMGILAALHETKQSGKGQTIDAAIVDGCASLMTNYFGLKAAGLMSNERGTNLNDSGAYFYDVYRCKDGKWVSIGPFEPKFHSVLLERIGIDAQEMPPQMDRHRWPEARARIAQVFLTRTRDEWSDLLSDTDACFAPVLDLDEAPHDAHLKARGVFGTIDGLVQPMPAPKFSRTPSEVAFGPQEPQRGDKAADLVQAWLGRRPDATALG